jgi:hypothetical protein
MATAAPGRRGPETSGGSGCGGVTVSTRNSALDDDHASRVEAEHLEAAFRAHLSPAFERITRTAVDAPTGREPTSSLATCEKVPTIPETVSDDAAPCGDSENGGVSPLYQDPPETAEEMGYISDATEAIRLSISRDRHRQRKVIELIKQGEVAHAKRLVNCGRQSVELECGDCGESNYVPIHCDSPLCPECGNRKMGRVAGRYGEEVAGWDHPTMLRVSMPKRVEPTEESIARAVDALRGGFGRLRRRKFPPNGDPPNGDGWSFEELASNLRMVGERDLAARLRTQYVNRGKWIPVEELLTGGFYAVDVKQKEDGRLNIHLHILADCAWLPQPVLSSLWDDLMDAPNVDVRRVYGRGQQDAEEAVIEAVGYAAKPPQYESVEDEVAYYRALKGAKLVQPFGELHGNTPDSDELRCEGCENVPLMGWEYLGIVEEGFGAVGSAPDGDRPPDDV